MQCVSHWLYKKNVVQVKVFFGPVILNSVKCLSAKIENNKEIRYKCVYVQV